MSDTKAKCGCDWSGECEAHRQCGRTKAECAAALATERAAREAAELGLAETERHVRERDVAVMYAGEAVAAANDRAQAAEKKLAEVERDRERTHLRLHAATRERDTAQARVRALEAEAVWKDGAIKHVLDAIEEHEDIDTERLRAAIEKEDGT